MNPLEYLRDVLERIATHRGKDVLELSPKLWKKARENVDATQLAAQV